MDLRGSGAGPLEADAPRRIGPIPLVGRLGAGGMGQVYLGVYEGRYVAVKQLSASAVGQDEDFLRRFGHELDNLARLPERITAPLCAGDRTARPPWLATAYVPGLTLGAALDLNGGPLPAPVLWLLLRELAAGLAEVHALDMVHRDLKPSNVMLTLDGVTLIDFGIARAAEQSRLTRTGMVVGTPAYMAPEQASAAGRSSGATDVFALGSMIAYAACGRPPFGDDSGHGVLYRIVHEEPDLEPLRELEPDLAETVAACLDKDPESRPTAAELVERAAAYAPSGPPVWPRAVTERLSERAAFAARVQEADVPTRRLGDRAAEQSDPPRRPARRRRTRVLLAAVAVVVGGTVLAVRYLPDGSAPEGRAGAAPSASAAGGSPSGTASPGERPGGDEATDEDRSGGDDTGPATSPAPATTGSGSGSFRYRNGDSGGCLVEVFGDADDEDCADPGAVWTLRSAPDGTFKLVNRQSGQCLHSYGLGLDVSVGGCAQDIGRRWRTGPGGSLRSEHGCLDLDPLGGLLTTTCSDEPSQHWARQL
ncbi:protein kinase [Streptomyces sp. NPDC003247]|uniref:serine/threonine-protein kinase n=1 Tax=Streptomyces sp. NPDC003247 TaxID=3364677 RepID=UPI0036BC3BA3